MSARRGLGQRLRVDRDGNAIDAHWPALAGSEVARELCGQSVARSSKTSFDTARRRSIQENVARSRRTSPRHERNVACYGQNVAWRPLLRFEFNPPAAGSRNQNVKFQVCPALMWPAIGSVL